MVEDSGGASTSLGEGATCAARGPRVSSEALGSATCPALTAGERSRVCTFALQATLFAGKRVQDRSTPYRGSRKAERCGGRGASPDTGKFPALRLARGSSQRFVLHRDVLALRPGCGAWTG